MSVDLRDNVPVNRDREIQLYVDIASVNARYETLTQNVAANQRDIMASISALDRRFSEFAAATEAKIRDTDSRAAAMVEALEKRLTEKMDADQARIEKRQDAAEKTIEVSKTQMVFWAGGLAAVGAIFSIALGLAGFFKK